MTDSITELSQTLKRFAQKRDWEKFHNPKNLSMALSVEASELVEHFQWLTSEQSCNLNELKRKEVALELADIQIYLLRISEVLDVDLIASTYQKIAINEGRFPVSKDEIT